MINDLPLDRQRLVLALLEHLDQAAAARQLLLRRGVEVGAELREGGHFAVLRQLEAQRSGDLLMALICAMPPTRDTEIPTFTAGRTPEKNRSVSRKIWPSVIEITLVGM